jgi:DNA-binding IclR family transcriptional regulator
MMRVEQVIGSRVSLHVTAVGKLFLAEGGNQACREYVCSKLSPNSILASF